MKLLNTFEEHYKTKRYVPFADASNQAWERFLELGLPQKNDEAFRYVHLSDLELCKPSEEAPSAMPSFLDHQLPKELIVLPLTKAWKTFGNFLQGKIASSIKNEKNPFALLNMALCEEGLFIYLPPYTACKAPLDLFHAFKGSFPRLHIVLGKNAELEITLRNLSDRVNFSNHYVEVALEEGAKLKIREMFAGGKESTYLKSLRATLKRHSELEILNISHGAGCARWDGEVKLLGEEAKATLKGITRLVEKQESHVYLRVEHLAPSTYSLQKFKTILDGFSRSSFEGKIYVAPEAQKTQAYQNNPNLLLSDRALAVSRPNLEIFADDVKASHGATCGALDQDHLFYLKSRGMDEETAKRVLVLGFAKEILEDLYPSPFYDEALSLVSS